MTFPGEQVSNRETKTALRNGWTITRPEVGALLTEIIERDYAGLRACARAWKISAAYISDVNNGRRDPGPAILGKLGLTKVVAVSYRAARKP